MKKLLLWALLLALLLCTWVLSAGAEDAPAITLVLDKTEVNVNQAITVTPNVTGGNTPYKELLMYWTIIEGEQEHPQVPIEFTPGVSIALTPRFGQKLFVKVGFLDSKGNYFESDAKMITIKGAVKVDPLDINFQFDPEDSIAVNHELKVKISATGGTPPYATNNFMRWEVFDNDSWHEKKYIYDLADKSTVAFTPDFGQKVKVIVQFKDDLGRSIAKHSKPIAIKGAPPSVPFTVGDISYDKDQLNLNEKITATLEVEGGKPPYEFEGIWYVLDGDPDTDKEAEFSEGSPAGHHQTSFIPTTGNIIQLAVTVYDAEGRNLYRIGSMIPTHTIPLESIGAIDDTALAFGETHTPVLSFIPANASFKEVLWTSSNPSVASVDANGKVTALALGTSDITATSVKDSSIHQKYKVTVTTLVSSINITAAATQPQMGKNLQLAAVVKPDGASNKLVTWASSDPSIATVDSTGKMTDVKPGLVTITATAQDGSGVKDEIKLLVMSSKKGDADGNKVVDTRDLLSLIAFLVNGKLPLSWENANVQADTQLDLNDLLGLIKLLVAD